MQTLKKRNVTLFFLDVYYAMESSKSTEPGMTKDELSKLVSLFKMITSAQNFTIIIFCSLQQIGAFELVLRAQLNIAPEVGIWHRSNASQTNQYADGLTSSAEGVLIGYHDTMQSSQFASGVKASWQKPLGGAQNVFAHDGVTSTAVSLCP